MTDQLEIVKEIINLEDFVGIESSQRKSRKRYVGGKMNHQNRGDNDDKASKQRQET